MKKIALAAFSATALLALSACGDAADEDVVVEEATIEPAPVEPIVEETTVVEDGDAMADEAADATTTEEAPAE